MNCWCASVYDFGMFRLVDVGMHHSTSNDMFDLVNVCMHQFIIAGMHHLLMLPPVDDVGLS